MALRQRAKHHKLNAVLRLVFLGSDPIALPLLNWLVMDGSHLAEIVGVFTQPDRPVGRGQQVVSNAIKQWALARGLPVYQPAKLNEEARGEFAALHPDVALVMAYGHILKDDFIATPRLGTLNLHTSFLPSYRGSSPIQSAIASGDTETAVTLMRIVRALDAGPVADAERVSIATQDTALEVEQKLATACVPLLARTLTKLAAGSLSFAAQDHALATYCRKLAKQDGALDFTQPATMLAARINGLFPWPACTVDINGVPVKFGMAEAAAGGSVPGTIIGVDSGGLLIATGVGALRVLRLQRPGGRMLAATDFLRGFPIPIGTVLSSQSMPILVASTPFRR